MFWRIFDTCLTPSWHHDCPSSPRQWARFPQLEPQLWHLRRFLHPTEWQPSRHFPTRPRGFGSFSGCSASRLRQLQHLQYGSIGLARIGRYFRSKEWQLVCTVKCHCTSRLRESTHDQELTLFLHWVRSSSFRDAQPQVLKVSCTSSKWWSIEQVDPLWIRCWIFQKLQQTQADDCESLCCLLLFLPLRA